MRSNSGNGLTQHPITLSLLGATCATNLSTNPGAFIFGDGEWQFHVGLLKVTALPGGNVCATAFAGQTDNARTLDFYAPAMWIISGISDNEAYELAYSMVPNRDDVSTAGTVSIPRGEAFAADKLQLMNGGFAASITGTLTAPRALAVPDASGTFALALNGTTGSIGGGALAAGACASGTASVANSTTSMAVATSPSTYPGDGFFWHGYVSSAGTVTVKVCASVAGTPTASTYSVRVTQ